MQSSAKKLTSKYFFVTIKQVTRDRIIVRVRALPCDARCARRCVATTSERANRMMEEVINEILAAEAEAEKIRAEAEQKAEDCVRDAEQKSDDIRRSTEARLKAQRIKAMEEAEKQAAKNDRAAREESLADADALKKSYSAAVKKEGKKVFGRILNGNM